MESLIKKNFLSIDYKRMRNETKSEYGGLNITFITAFGPRAY